MNNYNKRYNTLISLRKILLKYIQFKNFNIPKNKFPIMIISKIYKY